MVHTHRARAEALPWYTPTIGRTEPHRPPQRWLPAQCTTHTIGQPTAGARTHTHSGHTQPHSAPQRMLPAQCTTPTIGQPQRARIPIGQGTRCGSTMRARTHTHSGRTQPHSEPQRWLPAQYTTPARAAALCYVCAYTYPQEHPQRARVHIANRNTRTGRARTQCTHHRGEIPPAPPYCVLYILTDLYKYRSVYTYTRVCMRAYI